MNGKAIGAWCLLQNRPGTLGRRRGTRRPSITKDPPGASQDPKNNLKFQHKALPGAFYGNVMRTLIIFMNKPFTAAALTGAFAALAAGTLVFYAPEARAACSGGNNICATFDPGSASTVSGIGGFTGTFTPPFGSPPSSYDLSKVRAQFAVSNYTGAGFTLTGISLTGQGISTTLPLANLAIPGNSAPGTPFLTSFSNLDSSISNPTLFNFSGSTISFTIPTGLNLGTTITASIQYQSADGSGQSTTSGNPFITTASVPGPLPLLGAGVAFSFSRSMRKRIKSSTKA